MSDVMPAIIAGAITLVVAVVGIVATTRQQKKQFANDLSQAETAIRHLLNHREWKQRTFRTIKLKMSGALSMTKSYASFSLVLAQSVFGKRWTAVSKRNTGDSSSEIKIA